MRSLSAVAAWRTVRALIRATHPEPTLAVTAVATALALGAGAPALQVGAAFLSGQLSVGWSNDWIDSRRDAVARREDKPVVRGDISRRSVGLAALLAALACIPLSLALGTGAGLLHLAAVTSAWSYNAVLKSTLLSWLPYALSFGAVPSVITLATPERELAPVWATAAGALLGVAGHLVNVLPDLEGDAATGVRGLPHRLGAGTSTTLAALLLVTATVLLALGRQGLDAWAITAITAAVIVTAVGLRAARRPTSRAAFRTVLVVAVLDVGLLVASGAALV